MDVERLISSVYKRPAIWDRGNKIYADKLQLYTCWSEISKELQIEESILRKKWKYLRDQFAVELGKFPLPSSSSEDASDSCTSRWQYFKSLLFLKNVVKPRLSVSNGNYYNDIIVKSEFDPNALTEESNEQIQPIETDWTAQGEAYYSNANQTINSTSTCSTSINTSTSSSRPIEETSVVPVKIRRITKSTSMSQTFPEYENEREKRSNLFTGNFVHGSRCGNRNHCESQDDDMMFLKSLLPYIRQIPRQKTLRFRRKLMDLVEGFVAYPTSPSSHSQQQTMYSHEPCAYCSDSASESSMVEPSIQNQNYLEDNETE